MKLSAGHRERPNVQLHRRHNPVGVVSDEANAAPTRHVEAVIAAPLLHGVHDALPPLVVTQAVAVPHAPVRRVDEGRWALSVPVHLSRPTLEPARSGRPERLTFVNDDSVPDRRCVAGARPLLHLVQAESGPVGSASLQGLHVPRVTRSARRDCVQPEAHSRNTAVRRSPQAALSATPCSHHMKVRRAGPVCKGLRTR